MENVADRIRRKIDELNLTQADVARASGCSPQRFNNYVKKENPRLPGVDTLVRIAKALRTTTDWLLGLSDESETQIGTVVFRVLELEGLAKDQAKRIVKIAEDSLELLSKLPSGENPQDRAKLAAEAVWRLSS